MVRTKADNSSRKAVAAKAPRKALGGGSSSSPAGTSSPSGNAKVSKYAGGNSACDRPTPDWQKGIAGFCVKRSVSNDDGLCSSSQEEILEGSSAGSSSSSSVCAGTSQDVQSQSSCDSGSEVKRNGIIDSDEDD